MYYMDAYLWARYLQKKIKREREREPESETTRCDHNKESGVERRKKKEERRNKRGSILCCVSLYVLLVQRFLYGKFRSCDIHF
jgi:hypothetical protein